MYAQLGDIIFEGLYAPSAFERSDSVSLPQHSRINRRPKQQFTGVDLGIVKIKILLHSDFIEIETAIEKFRTYRNRAEHLRYITGSGNVMGTFVIAETTETVSQTDTLGNYVSVELAITLIETVASTIKNKAVSGALANRRNNPSITPMTLIVPTMPVSAAIDVLEVRAITTYCDNGLGGYTSAPEDFTSAKSAKLSNIKDNIDNARQKMADAAAKVETAQDTADAAQTYVQNMYTAAQNMIDLSAAIENFNPLDPVGSMNGIVLANRNVMSGVSVMSNTSQPLAAYTGSRR